MKVVFKGKGRCLLTDYDGVRYAFYKDIPVEIDPKIYTNIVSSRHTDSADLMPYEEPLLSPEKKIALPPILKREELKKRGRPKK